MKIQIMSDLHLGKPFHNDCGKQFINDLDPTDIDVLILAGDIGELKDIELSIPSFCKKYKNVVMCQGNHSFWYSDKETVEKATEKLVKEFPNLHYLNNSLVEIDGQRFLGGTMWYKRTGIAAKLEDDFADFSRIKDCASWVYKDNLNFRLFLRDNLRENDIVVSHHLPSEKSIAHQYIGDPFNCFYVCDMEEIIKERKPKYWIHAHTHNSFDYMIGNTQVICNPYGYKQYGLPQNKNFDSKLVVEV